jgi:geranylgeranyl reductase family protein
MLDVAKDAPVLIVGAGPAGATAARTLAMAGVPVRLVDRAAFPRNKPCGGGISTRALHRFPHLARELARIPTHAVSRLYLEGPDGDATTIECDGPAALMVRRVDFDALLVNLAIEAGSELVSGVDIVQVCQTGSGVGLTARDGRRFEGSVVIGADGVHSVIARRLGLNPGWPSTAVALDMMEETPRVSLSDLDSSTLWVAYGFNPDGNGQRNRAAPEGYAYMFPKRDHVNAGVGYVLRYFRDAIVHSPYEVQRALIERLRDKGFVAGESVRQNFTPFLIPVAGPLRRLGRGRVLLAGDAGGFVNGFTAEGIYYAMVSGELAAQAIIQSPDPASPAARYARIVDREIGGELRDSVLIQRYLFADRRRITAIIDAIHRRPAMTRLILDYARGRCGYRELRRRILARSPLLALRLVWERLMQVARNAEKHVVPGAAQH